jgi:hypothetical protein
MSPLVYISRVIDMARWGIGFNKDMFFCYVRHAPDAHAWDAVYKDGTLLRAPTLGELEKLMYKKLKEDEEKLYGEEEFDGA